MRHVVSQRPLAGLFFCVLMGITVAAQADNFTPTTDFIDNGDGTVTHMLTGLTWMRCAEGQSWTGSNCDGIPSTYTWDQATALVSSFTGHSDWRLPSPWELATIVDYDNYGPAINLTIFPSMAGWGFWSASPAANGTIFTWGVEFFHGTPSYMDQSSGSPIRLVRGGQSFTSLTTPSSDFTDNGDGTVTHKKTNLTWKRCAEGQNWTGSTCAGTASSYTWDQSIALTSSFAGQSDWRIPNIQELQSIIEYGTVNPAINTVIFPNTPSSNFWSGSPVADSSSNAWVGYFYYGGAYRDYNRSDTYHVRLLRGSQTITITPASDTTPDAFSFTAQTNVAPGSLVESDTVVVAGISSSASISITGGEYSINGSSWTSASGSISLGSQIKVRLTAPTGYAQTGTATLTIGGVQSIFSVTTRSFTPVTSASEVFSNPQTATVDTTGVVHINTAPAAPLQLTSAAVQNAVIALDTASAVPVAVNGTTLNYTRESSGTTLQVRSINGSPALAPIAGSVTIDAPTSGSTIPVTGDSSGSAVLQTTTANTRVSTGPDSSRNVVVAVSSGGKVTYQASSRGRTLPASFEVYPGEAVIADESGTAGQVRLGSRAQDGSQAGDYLASMPRANASLKVPQVTGSSQRFGGDWTTLVGQAIAGKLGLGTFSSLSQDSSTGMLTLTTSTGIYRFLPVGSLALADSVLNGGSRAVAVASIAANLTAILDSSLSFAVAPATAYADLETALKTISASASLEILGDGVLKARLSGTDYIAQPAAQATAGNSTGCPGFDTVGNQLALCDASGKRQVLYAAFADTDTLRGTFRTDLSLPTLAVSNNGSNGTYAAQVGGSMLTLTPDFTLTTPPSSQAGKLWWSDATSGKLFIRYPNGAAQGFSLQ